MSSIATRRVGRGMTSKSSKGDSVAPGVAPEEGFEVQSECGRGWFVPMTAVQANYAEYLAQADGLDDSAAMVRAGKSKADLHSWFAEQFDWADIDRYGRLTKEASAEHIARALNAVRADGSPSDSSKLLKLTPA